MNYHRKNRFLIYSTILFLLTGLSSCTEEINYKDTYKTNHYIYAYLEPNAIEIEVPEISPTLKQPEYPLLELKFVGRSIPQGGKKGVEGSAEEYWRIAERYEDTAYPPGVMSNHIKPIVLYEPIRSVSIMCKSDFDAQHKANESLDDIAEFKTQNIYDFIQDGYPAKRWFREEDIGFWKEYGWAKTAMHFRGIEAPMPRMPRDGYHMVCNKESHILFKKNPDKPGVYRFVVTIVCGSKTIKGEVDYTFDPK